MTSNSGNPAKGRDFERRVGRYLNDELRLGVVSDYEIKVSINGRSEKVHKFDWGNETLLVECKAYTWTAGGNNPSAKLATANEALLYLLGAPTRYRKMLFMPETPKRGQRRPETLVEYYVRTYGHLIPEDVDVYELNEQHLSVRRGWPL